MWEMGSKVRDGLAWGRTAWVCQSLRKKLSPRRWGLGKALLSVSAKASLPRLPRQRHSHLPGLPQEPETASHQGRTSAQTDKWKPEEFRPPSHPNTSLAGSRGQAPWGQPAGLHSQARGAPTRTSEANLQREFPSAVCTPLFSHTGSELSDLRAGSFLGCPWVLIIAWPLSPHFLSHGPRAERGCVVTPVCWLRRFPMTRGALGC